MPTASRTRQLPDFYMLNLPEAGQLQADILIHGWITNTRQDAEDNSCRRLFGGDVRALRGRGRHFCAGHWRGVLSRISSGIACCSSIGCFSRDGTTERFVVTLLQGDHALLVGW